VAKRIDIVVPALNEEATLEAFHRELSRVLDALPHSFRVLFIDDGSTDHTARLCVNIKARDPRVGFFRFSRNFGQQAAISAGLDWSDADAVITMDADLQNPPEVIPLLIAAWEQGAEVVHAVRENGAQGNAIKAWTSRSFYTVLGKIAEVHLEHNAADFRLIDAKVVRAVRRLEERNRFLRGLYSWVGFKHTSVTYRHPVRTAGASKYGLRRMVALALVAMVSLTRLPLHLATLVGGLLAAVGLCSLVYLGALTIFSHKAGDATAIAALILFVGGLQIGFLGILGEYIGQLLGEAKRRPIYIIAEAAPPAEPEEEAAAPFQQ